METRNKIIPTWSRCGDTCLYPKLCRRLRQGHKFEDNLGTYYYPVSKNKTKKNRKLSTQIHTHTRTHTHTNTNTEKVNSINGCSIKAIILLYPSNEQKDNGIKNLMLFIMIQNLVLHFCLANLWKNEFMLNHQVYFYDISVKLTYHISIKSTGI